MYLELCWDYELWRFEPEVVVDSHKDEDGEDHGVVAQEGAELERRNCCIYTFVWFFKKGFFYLCREVGRELELLEPVGDGEGAEEEDDGEKEDVRDVLAAVANQSAAVSDNMKLFRTIAMSGKSGCLYSAH